MFNLYYISNDARYLFSFRGRRQEEEKKLVNSIWIVYFFEEKIKWKQWEWWRKMSSNVVNGQNAVIRFQIKPILIATYISILKRNTQQQSAVASHWNIGNGRTGAVHFLSFHFNKLICQFSRRQENAYAMRQGTEHISSCRCVRSFVYSVSVCLWCGWYKL